MAVGGSRENGAAPRRPPPPLGPAAAGGSPGMAGLYVELRSLTRFAAAMECLLAQVDEADAEARRELKSNYPALLEAWGDSAAQIRSKCMALNLVTARIMHEVDGGTWSCGAGEPK